MRALKHEPSVCETAQFADFLTGMSPLFQCYIVRPKPGGGFFLSGPRLPFTLLYTRDDFAIGYARHMLRDVPVGAIWLLDSTGHPIIAETVQGDCPRLLGQ